MPFELKVKNLKWLDYAKEHIQMSSVERFCGVVITNTCMLDQICLYTYIYLELS